MEPSLAFLAERPIAVISTISPDGSPHAVPVEVVVSGEAVYTWGHASAGRAKNLRERPLASITAYKGNRFVMVSGPVQMLTESDEGYWEVTAMFLSKYGREETYGNNLLVRLVPSRTLSRLD